MKRAPGAHCVVCGIPLAGVAAAVLAWRGIGRSARNPNLCTRCGAHLEEGRLVELTVLFADLSSFTAMTGRLGAEATYSVVDEYLRLAAGVLMSRGATIDKFIGDAVMAFFNVPIRRSDHEAAAVTAAQELQAAIPGLSEKLGVELRASIGIASGFARVGRLGSDDPKDYSAIGECVNQAARLQAQARAGETLVSEAVYRKVAASFPGVAPESLALKGFSERSVAYRLDGAPAGPPAESTPDPRPAMSWSALLLALLGSGCLGKTVALAAALAYGAASAASLSAVAVFLDEGPLRAPVLWAATAASTAVLFYLLRQRRLRRECVARHHCLEMTADEKRYVARAAALACAALALVAFELLSHRFDVGMGFRRVLAKAVASRLR